MPAKFGEYDAMFDDEAQFIPAHVCPGVLPENLMPKYAGNARATTTEQRADAQIFTEFNMSARMSGDGGAGGGGGGGGGGGDD
eukprot:112114-Pleurochrysis_carterae.AAC.1